MSFSNRHSSWKRQNHRSTVLRGGKSDCRSRQPTPPRIEDRVHDPTQRPPAQSINLRYGRHHRRDQIPLAICQVGFVAQVFRAMLPAGSWRLHQASPKWLRHPIRNHQSASYSTLSGRLLVADFQLMPTPTCDLLQPTQEDFLGTF